MRKSLLLLFLSITVISYSLEQVLIDFSKLDNTTINLREQFKIIGQDAGELEEIDLTIPNWTAKLIPSSNTTKGRDKTFVLPVDKSIEYQDQNILGVRVYFPQRHSNSHVEIYPPFEIPSFFEDPDNPDGMGTYFINKGVIRNVGIIRRIYVRVLGNGFDYRFYIRIKDQNNNIRDIHMGMINFLGWRTLVWSNPNYDREKKYISETKDTAPYYPSEYPYVKFIGIIIQRDKVAKTGNFTTMVKDITMEYDERFIENKHFEYIQEDVFGIYKEELNEVAEHEMKKVARSMYQQFVESRKMDGYTRVIENDEEE